MNTVERYIQTEKLALKTNIPIDSYVKNRPGKIETHQEYFKQKFHHDNSKKAHSDDKKFLRADMDYEEINQKINNYRNLSDSLANVKLTSEEIKKIYPTVRKIIQNRFI